MSTPAPSTLPTLDDAITTAGDALDAAEGKVAALAALLVAMEALDAASEDPRLSKDVARTAYAWIPAEGFEATRAQLHTATAEVRRLELAVAAAQQAFRAAEAEAKAKAAR